MKPGKIEVDHTVRKGETLWSIAETYLGDGNRWQFVASMNKLEPPYKILVGQSLKINSIDGGSDHGPSLFSPPAKDSERHSPFGKPISKGAKSADAAPQAASKSALPVIPPAFKYEWKKTLPPVVMGAFIVTQSIKGSIAIQDQRDMSGITRDQKTVYEYKRQADGVLKDVDNLTKIKWDPSSPKKLEVSLGYAVKHQGEVLSAHYATIVPPAGVKYSFEGREMIGNLRSHKFKAKLGFDIEAQPRGPAPSAPAPVTFWVGVGLVTLGVVMIGATVIENIGTAGAGAAIDAVTFPTAMRMIGVGLPAVVQL